MVIGVAGYINPIEFKDYLDKDQGLFEDNFFSSAVNTLVKEFVRQGHVVHVFSSHTKGSSEYHFNGERLHIHMIGTQPSIRHFGVLSEFYMANRVARLINPYVEEMDVLHSHWTYYYALAARKYKYKIPVVCTVRDWCPAIYKSRESFMEKLLWGIKMIVFRIVMRDTKISLIANSESTFERIIESYPHRRPSLIYNPIDRGLVIDKKTSRIPVTTFISISQSIDMPLKNIYTLVVAFKDYLKEDNQARLILVGNYDKKGVIYQFVEKNHINQVEFTGKMSHDKVLEAIDRSTCLVHPSYEETFGNILIEAMARCVPCIGGVKSGGVPYVLGQGKYGLLCDISNPSSLLSAMKKTMDRDYIDTIVLRANERIRNSYSSDVVAKKHFGLYKDLLR